MAFSKWGFFWLVMIPLILLWTYYAGYWYVLNEPLNEMIAGAPDVSCTQDADCVLRGTVCNTCSCGEAVNKAWQPYCPFEHRILCKPCPDQEAYCNEGTCAVR